MPTVSGHKIRQAIERVNLRRKTATKQFEKSIFAFEGENTTPQQFAATIERTEFLLASLQDLQERFNQATMVNLTGQNLTLALAIKLVGGNNRLAKSWKNAAELAPGTDDIWSRRLGGSKGSVQFSRDKEKDYATRQITVEQCIASADASSSKTASLRAAIAEANSSLIEVPETLLPLFVEFLPGLL